MNLLRVAIVTTTLYNGLAIFLVNLILKFRILRHVAQHTAQRATIIVLLSYGHLGIDTQSVPDGDAGVLCQTLIGDIAFEVPHVAGLDVDIVLHGILNITDTPLVPTSFHIFQLSGVITALIEIIFISGAGFNFDRTKIMIIIMIIDIIVVENIFAVSHDADEIIIRLIGSPTINGIVSSSGLSLGRKISGVNPLFKRVMQRSGGQHLFLVRYRFPKRGRDVSIDLQHVHHKVAVKKHIALCGLSVFAIRISHIFLLS